MLLLPLTTGPLGESEDQRRWEQLFGVGRLPGLPFPANPDS